MDLEETRTSMSLEKMFMPSTASWALRHRQRLECLGGSAPGFHLGDGVAASPPHSAMTHNMPAEHNAQHSCQSGPLLAGSPGLTCRAHPPPCICETVLYIQAVESPGASAQQAASWHRANCTILPCSVCTGHAPLPTGTAHGGSVTVRQPAQPGPHVRAGTRTRPAVVG